MATTIAEEVVGVLHGAKPPYPVNNPDEVDEIRRKLGRPPPLSVEMPPPSGSIGGLRRLLALAVDVQRSFQLDRLVAANRDRDGPVYRLPLRGRWLCG